jgi:uncharacterized membrane protein YhiD involved in acid resistance
MNSWLTDRRLWLLLACLAGTILLFNGSPTTQTQAHPLQSPPTPELFEAQPSTPSSFDGVPLFRFEGFWDTLAEVAPALLLAALLGGLIAYRRRLTVFEHNLFHAHILLSVAGALMMLIVGNQLVRAFGLLGAASVVRYRYGLRNPRDASMLIIALGIGMATGVGLYALAISAAAVVFVFVHGLDFLSSRTQLLIIVTRPVTLRVQTTQPDETLARIEQIFARQGIKARLRRLRRARRRKIDGLSVYTLVYTVQIGPDDSRSALTSEIADPSVASVRWQTEKPSKQ